MKTRAILLFASVCVALIARAGTTGQTALHMPQGSASGTPNGDYVSDAGGLNSLYRYFVEVPQNLTQLTVEIFDADVGRGGAAEDDAGRDRDRGGGFTTNVTYSLLNPSGTTVATLTCGVATCTDNAWDLLYNEVLTKTVRDQFGTVSYSNNDGTNDWSSAWFDAEDGNPAAGDMRITGGEMRLGEGNRNIYREANLGSTGMNLTSATLTYDYRTSGNLDAPDTVVVEVSPNGGTSWNLLATYTNDVSGSASFDITSSIAANTRVRFSFNTGANEFFFVDNVQISGSGPIPHGHWELDIDTVGGNDINAIGIRAHDGTSGAGGTELNVYADSMVSLGVNPDPDASTRSFTLYPWVTSGCVCSQNDFDRDTGSGDTGSTTYTSRIELASPGTGFTQTFASTTLSINNAWNHDDLTRWGDDDESDDYGIWRFVPTINTYGFTSGNYETTYVGSYLTSGNPTSNPILSGGAPAAFRVYLPTDAGAAPVKPYFEQFLTHNRDYSGPNPGQVGVQTVYTVTVKLVNPTAYPITFSSPSNLVIANVPGGGVTYNGATGGLPTFTQGSMVSQPAAGGTGIVSWNPGTVAAGATVIMAYAIRVTPPDGARLPVTSTPASGSGTRAIYVDETANTTQTRATYTMGGVCELAVTAALATEVMLSSFELDVRGGATTIEFSTASEAGTIGFNVLRAGTGEQVNETLIPASLKPQGGKYRLLDRGNSDPNALYTVEEVTASGVRKHYGPLNHLKGVDREAGQRRDHRRVGTSSLTGWEPQSDAPKEKIVAAMVGVRGTGIVRVSAAGLAVALGEKEHTVAKALGNGKLSVTFNGAAVSWTTDGQNLLFFGEKSTSIYSDERVYRVALTAGTTMQTVRWSPASAAVSPFLATQEIEQDTFVAAVLPIDPAGDFNFWEFVISGDPTYGRRTFPVNVPAMASSSGASLAVRLQGALKDATHLARISLNGVPLGDLTWTSLNAHNATVNIPAAVLRDGANEIVVEGVLAPGAPFDVFYIDGFTLQYQKFARPEAGQIAVRTQGALGAGPFAVAPLILDVSSPLRPAVVTGATFQGGTASVTVPSTKNLFLSESYLAPSSLRGSPETTIKGKLRAEWLIIAPRSMRTPAESLARLRQRDGLSTFVADLEQVYDEFGGGNLTPLAIRDFLRSTRSWSVKPRYVVLAGTGSVDYRGISTAPGPMPPILTSTPDGIFAADSLYTDFNGDRLPDVAIGRIPVKSAAELSAYVAKLDANSRIAAGQSPIVFSADAADGGASFRAESVQAELPLSGRPATRVYLDDLGGSAARTALIAAWQAGSPLVSWVGHGGLDQISNAGVLTSYDAGTLESAGRLPILVAMTCTINRFENGVVDPLGVALTREDGAGALAVWSASGLSQHAQASEIQRTFMHLAAQALPTTRLGDLIVSALKTNKSDTSSIYLLLGDPAIRLDLPTEVTNGGNPVNSGE